MYSNYEHSHFQLYFVYYLFNILSQLIMLIVSLAFRFSDLIVVCLNGTSPEKYLLLFCVTSFLKFVKGCTNGHRLARYLSDSTT